MVRDAEAHAAEDKRRREMVELKNQSDSLAYQSEKTLNELGDKVDSVQKGRAEELIKDLRDAIAQEDEDKMRSLSERAAAADDADLAERLQRAAEPAGRRRRQQGRRRGRGRGRVHGRVITTD